MKKSHGFIALIITIMTGSVLSILVYAGLLHALVELDNLTYQEHVSQSYYLAASCSNDGILRVLQDSSYKGNDIVSIASSTCSILSVSMIPSSVTIESEAQVSNSYIKVSTTSEIF